METKHYLIIYRPPRVTFADDATADESAVVGEHFEYLKKLLADGTLVLAGRTDDASMGLAIFEARDEAAAHDLMQNDPAVRAGVFSGELHRYHVALLAGAE
jgi:uncharacterized protein YciI